MRLGKPTLALIAFVSLTAAADVERRYSECTRDADRAYSLAWSARCHSLGRPISCALADSEYRDIDSEHVRAVLSCLDRIRPEIPRAGYDAERQRLLRQPLPSLNVDTMPVIERWALTSIVITLLLGLLVEILRRPERKAGELRCPVCDKPYRRSERPNGDEWFSKDCACDVRRPRAV